MMDCSGRKSIKSEPGLECEDWRSKLSHDFREKVVNYVVENLKNRVPFFDPNTLNQLNTVAVKLENIYHNATMKNDYVAGICKKMTEIENSCNQSIAAYSSNPASVESTSHIQHTNAADWHAQRCQELQSMRNSFLPKLIEVYNRVHGRCLKATQLEVLEKLKNYKIMIEKMMKFLRIARSDIVRFTKDKFVYYQQAIIRCLHSIRKNPVSLPHYNKQLQLPGGQSQIAQLPQCSNMNLQFHPGSIPLTRTPASSSHLMSTQQGVPKLQINMINSLQFGSEVGSEQQNAPCPLIQHDSARSIFQNIVSAPQQTKSSHNTHVNASHAVVNMIQPSSNFIPPQHSKQQQKHQIMLPHKMYDGNDFIPPQHSKQQQKYQIMLPHKLYDGNDLRVRQSMDVGLGMLQQQHSTSQCRDPHQSLLRTTPCQPNVTTPLMPLHSSPSSSTPSSLSMDLDKHHSGVSPPSIAENAGHPQTPVSVALVQPEIQIQNQSLVISTPGLAISPLLTEFTSPDGNQQLPESKKPLERLIEMVKLMSPKALSASLCDIGSVISMTDRLARITAGKKSIAATGEDLSGKTRCRSQTRTFKSQYGCSSVKRMKRHISAMALDPLPSSDDGFKQLSGQIYDSESTAASRKKRRSIELNNAILEEIRYINQRLVETVVDVVLDSNEDAVTTISGEGTVVRCSYSAVALSENFKLQCASSQMFSSLRIWFFVPTNYPNYFPTVLDRSPVDCRCDIECHDSKESEDLSEKAKVRFYRSLHNLSQPVSLKEMARTWDVCARAVFFEYAQLVRGECFSSRYGAWEDCVAAS